MKETFKELDSITVQDKTKGDWDINWTTFVIKYPGKMIFARFYKKNISTYLDISTNI